MFTGPILLEICVERKTSPATRLDLAKPKSHGLILTWFVGCGMMGAIGRCSLFPDKDEGEVR